MVFSVDDHVLIKVLRQEKWYGANSPVLNPVDYQVWVKLQRHVYRSIAARIMTLIDQLKLPLIEEFHFHVMHSGIAALPIPFHFHHVFIDEMIRQWRPRLRAHSSIQRTFGTHFSCV